jgi:spore coat polysaccharide biosynthesis predicted glycosyltransferase SpsG
VVVRCDAGPTYGVGHVMRCIALAEEFAARACEVVFVADLDAVPWARDQVRGRGFGHVQPPPDDEVAFLVSFAPAFVVLDSYILPAEVCRGLRTSGIRVLAIVDGDPAARPADLVLDQNIGAEDDLWQTEPGSVRLAGLDYALMRNQIRASRPVAPRAADRDPVRVFAFFGGTDAYGAAPVVAAAAAATGLPWAMTMVAATSELAKACEAVALTPSQHLQVIPTTTDLAQHLETADVVLSAAGTSSWELLCAGAAAGLVCVAQNQEVSYDRAVAAGLVIGLGRLDALRSLEPLPALAELLADVRLRTELRRQGWSRVDGRGRERVVDAWEALEANPW